MTRFPTLAAALLAAGLLCPTGRAAPQDEARKIADKVTATNADAKDKKDAHDHKDAAHAHAKDAKPVVVQVRGFAAHKDKVKGTVTFSPVEGGGVRVVANLTGLTPGKHGFHIHEKAIQGDDPMTAGAHWNPGKKDHGGPDAHARHSGDLGNITADAQGNGKLELVLKDITTGGTGDHSIIGKAVIVHDKEDDLKSQPGGNAGDRIAGGNITAAAGGHGHGDADHKSDAGKSDKKDAK